MTPRMPPAVVRLEAQLLVGSQVGIPYTGRNRPFCAPARDSWRYPANTTETRAGTKQPASSQPSKPGRGGEPPNLKGDQPDQIRYASMNRPPPRRINQKQISNPDTPASASPPDDPGDVAMLHLRVPGRTTHGLQGTDGHLWGGS